MSNQEQHTDPHFRNNTQHLTFTPLTKDNQTKTYLEDMT